MKSCDYMPLSYQFSPTLELPTTPPEDVELRVYVDGWEMYDQGFMSLSGFCAVLLEWDVLPSNSVVIGEVTITVDDPDAFYIEQDGLNFWLHPQVSHQDFLVTLSIPTTAGVLTKEFWIGVFPIHWRALVDFMPIGVEDGVTTIYTYDVFNRLTGVNGVGVSGNAVDAQYTYRPDGLRIAKVVNGVRTTHLWDGANIVAELDNDNEIKDVYIRGIGLIKNGQDQWFLFNARGDVIALTDTSGNVIREYRYDAFGNELNPDPDDTNPWRFTGEYLDIETGTIYLRARHYNPRIGRFTQADPFFRANNRASLNIYTVRQTANLYAYVANNPVRFIDPNGLWLRDFANAAGTNDINWNASTRTATLTINGITHSFRDGANGNIHTTGSRAGIMEVDQAYFNRVFGLGGGASSTSNSNTNQRVPTVLSTSTITSTGPNVSSNSMVSSNAVGNPNVALMSLGSRNNATTTRDDLLNLGLGVLEVGFGVPTAVGGVLATAWGFPKLGPKSAKYGLPVAAAGYGMIIDGGSRIGTSVQNIWNRAVNFFR